MFDSLSLSLSLSLFTFLCQQLVEVVQWWRSNGGGDRERNVGLECRVRETNGEKEKRRKRERVRHQTLLSLEIGLEYNK